MFVLMTLLTTAFMLVFLLKLAAQLISESVGLSREELSPYECGFEHHSVSRVPLSLRFFFLTLLFLLFDLELVLLLFYPTTSFSWFNSVLAVGFILALWAGLFYEWVDGSLEWIL